MLHANQIAEISHVVVTDVILRTIKNQLKNVSKIVGNLKVSRQEEIQLLKHPEGSTNKGRVTQALTMVRLDMK